MSDNSYNHSPMDKDQLIQVIQCIETICKTAKGEQIQEEAKVQNDSMISKVGDFHKACDAAVFDEDKACQFSEDKSLRMNLLKEEFIEYMEAEENADIVGVADALADMIYIIMGTAHSYNIPIEEIFNEVHATNMAKVGSDGKVKRREDGKILKPEGWTPPNLKGIIDDFNKGKTLSDFNVFVSNVNSRREIFEDIEKLFENFWDKNL